MIIISEKEADDIITFIRGTLYSEWDQYTNTRIASAKTTEDGMRQMNPDMYDFANELRDRLCNAEN